MNAVHNHYRYSLSNRFGTLITDPLGESDFTIEWNRETGGKLFYQKSLPSTIEFRGAAYRRLLKLERSQYRCEYQYLTVERPCTNSGTLQWVPWFSGRISLNDGDWNISGCTVILKLDEQKPEQCYEDNRSTEINLFSSNITPRTIYLTEVGITLEKHTSTTNGDINSDACNFFIYWDLPGDPFAQGWNYYYYRHETTYPNGSVYCTLETRWAREVKFVACADPSPGPEWILVDDQCPTGQRKYARPCRVYGCVSTYPMNGDPTEVFSYSCNVVGDAGVIQFIDHGIPVEDVFSAFATAFCPGLTVISNFLQINPDIVSNTNYVTSQRTKTKFITLFQKSDVKRPNVSNNARKANLNWEDFLTFLVEAYNLRWRIENNIFRIEHVSYFTRNAGTDLTLPRYAKDVRGLFSYTYQNQDIPQREEYKWMEASAGDFAGAPIVYTGACVTASNKSNVQPHAVDFVTTDVQLCLSNPDSQSKVVDDDGFVFIAADYDGTNYYIITEPGILSNDAQLNNSLAWAQLHRDYHRYDRALSRGMMNNVATNFLSVRPTKRGKAITFPLCCGDTFNPDDTIQTAIGTGIVDKATFSFRAETLTVELLYDAEAGLTMNRAPQAGGDNATTYLNQPVIINVLANDSDPDPGAVITAVQISMQPLLGTAVVLPNMSIEYTPNNGYTGPDQFLYRIFDEWNEPSNNALVAIMVYATNQPPVAMDDNYAVNENSQLSINAPGLFANDTDDNGFTLDIYDSTSVQGGTVVVNANGSFSYNPPANYVGPDSFTYRIKDAQGLTDIATVNINVLNPDYPVANDDYYSTAQNQQLVVAAPGLLANDTTQIGTLSVVAQNVPTAQGGTANIANNGGFTYNPPSGFIGNDSFLYTASNGTGNDQATANITVYQNLYIHLQKVNDTSQNLNIVCNGINQYGGQSKTATFRVFFYSDAAGTIPADTTGLNLIVNYVVNGTYFDPPGNYSLPNNAPASGTQTDLLTNYEYYRVEYYCGGAIADKKDETITLQPGNYTII